MTKADVMSNWDRVVTDPKLTLAGANAHITAKLRGYRSGRVPDSRMTDVAHELSDEEIAAATEAKIAQQEGPEPGK